MLSSKFGPTVLACCVWFSSTGNVCAQSSLGVIEEHLQSAYARVAPAIVKFSYDNFWLGSGVIVTPEGHIVVGGGAGAIIEDKLLDVRLVDGREPWVYDTKFIAPSFLLPQRDSWHDNFWTARFPTIHIGGASGGGVFDPQGRLVGVLQGGSQMSEEDKGQMQHMRIELFLKNWEQLAASTKVGQSGQHAPLNELFNTVSKQCRTV